MTTHSVETQWDGKTGFHSTVDGHIIRTNSDADTGPSPKKLLLAGLAGCTGLDVISILEKMHISIHSLQIHADAIYTGISLTYRIGGKESDKEKYEKAIRLSVDKYCGVMAMLSKTANISYTLEVI
jgi:putative redox protein